MRDTPCSNAHPQFYTLKGLDCTATMDCGIILLLLCFLCVEESQGQCKCKAAVFAIFSFVVICQTSMLSVQSEGEPYDFSYDTAGMGAT